MISNILRAPFKPSTLTPAFLFSKKTRRPKPSTPSANPYTSMGPVNESDIDQSGNPFAAPPPPKLTYLEKLKDRRLNYRSGHPITEKIRNMSGPGLSALLQSHASTVLSELTKYTKKISASPYLDSEPLSYLKHRGWTLSPINTLDWS